VVVDFRRKRTELAPVYINGDTVERVKDFKFLGTHISQDINGATNTTALVKKSQQRLYFLRSINKMNLSQKMPLSFYNCSVQSIISHDILVWFSCTTADKKVHLPSLTDISHQMPAVGKKYHSGLFPHRSQALHFVAIWKALQIFPGSHF